MSRDASSSSVNASQPAPTGVSAVAPLVRIWPLSQHDHDRVVLHVVEKLVGSNVLTQHYSKLSMPETQRDAAAVEAEAYAAADSAAGRRPVSLHGGVGALTAYTNDIDDCLHKLLDSRHADAEGSAPAAASASAQAPQASGEE